MTWWQDDIRDTADALTEPCIHRAPIPEWDQHRNRRIRRHHQTVQPGLLAQLYQSVIPSSSTPADPAPGGGKPGSRPPLALDALSTHAMITSDTYQWCLSIGLPLRGTVESNIRQLCAKAMSFDETAARELLRELHRWRRWCLVMTGWEQVRPLRHVTCTHATCGKVGAIRVNLTARSAMCLACGGTWSDDDGTLDQLIAHATAAA